MKKKTSIIILTYNNFAMTKDCILSIRKYTNPIDYEIIVVDNCSTDETVSWLKEQTDLHVIFMDENVGFPKGCNIGIEASSKENDILLLNNDTIVTSNWLNNLQTCLHSDERIGAVGAVSNNGANLQGVEFAYSNFEEMQEKALLNNVSDKERWEEKVCLIGYCMLIKREVIESLGGLDEGYSPGYIEDNDLSLRILNLGYKIYLCHDAFIHHYLGTSFRKNAEQFNQLILKNREYFTKKWGFSVFTFDHTKNLSAFLGVEPTVALDYQCGIGTSLLRIKYLFPKAHVIGVEKDLEKQKIAKLVGEVHTDLTDLKKEFFDTIFIGNFLEEAESPLVFLYEIQQYLKPNGYIIGEFQNMSSIEHIKMLFDDSWYYSRFQMQNHFTKKDIERMFADTGYINAFFYAYPKEVTEDEKKIMEDNFLGSECQMTYYAFSFQKKDL